MRTSTKQFKHKFRKTSPHQKGPYPQTQNGTLEIRSQGKGMLFPRNIESIKRLFRKTIKSKSGQLIIPPQTHKMPLSKKPLQTRMGKGKGKPSGAYTPIYPGQPMIIIKKFYKPKSLRIPMKKLATKLSIPTKLITNLHLAKGRKTSRLKLKRTITTHNDNARHQN